MKRKLTDLVSEVLAKSQTEEGRRELGEERERLEAEALQQAAQREKRLEAPLEAGKDAQEPPEVCPERRNDRSKAGAAIRGAPQAGKKRDHQQRESVHCDGRRRGRS